MPPAAGFHLAPKTHFATLSADQTHEKAQAALKHLLKKLGYGLFALMVAFSAAYVMSARVQDAAHKTLAKLQSGELRTTLARKADETNRGFQEWL